MTIYTFPLSPTASIKLWDLQEDTAVVQFYSPEKRSRKSTSKVKEYNGRRFVTCLGHRYYLDKFQQVEI